MLPLRTPAATVGGIVYFGRTLDKIRVHAAGNLPPEYQANLGKGFDDNCATFLRISYNELAERVQQGGTDEEILEWCFRSGYRPSADEVAVWNEFMLKRGWRDDVTEFLVRRKKEAGFTDRSDIETMFEYIDAGEASAPDGQRLEDASPS